MVPPLSILYSPQAAKVTSLEPESQLPLPPRISSAFKALRVCVLIVVTRLQPHGASFGSIDLPSSFTSQHLHLQWWNGYMDSSKTTYQGTESSNLN